MITLYQTEWCPHGHRVRQALTELGLTYTMVNVPAEKADRLELKEVCGADGVPALLDGKTVLCGADAIVEHLRATYPPAADAAVHEQMGFFRYVLEKDMAPAAALTHLKEMLLKHRFEVVAEIGIAPSDADADGTYTLLHAVVPAAIAMDLAADPSVPSSLTIPMSVYPVGKGSQIAITDPLVGVWLFGQPELLKAAGKLRQRVKQLFEEL
jgi:glutaredoxin